MADRPTMLGVVLAAGESRRMGRPKALLPCGADGETFVARIVGTLTRGGLTDVVVVGRPADVVLHEAVRALGPSVRYLENASADRGQIASILVGVAEAERARAAGILVLPVDVPLVRSATISAALQAFQTNSAPVVRVTHRGRHGHPVIFGGQAFTDLRRADPSVGARAVLRSYGDHVLNLEVDDPAVLWDVDVPEDYRRLFGFNPP